MKKAYSYNITFHANGETEVSFYDKNDKIITGDFYYNGNINIPKMKITSFKNFPRKVFGSVDCSYNEIKSLKGCSEYIEGSLDLSGNPISFNKEHIPQSVGGDITCFDIDIQIHSDEKELISFFDEKMIDYTLLEKSYLYKL